MAEKVLSNVRVQSLYDTYTNWTTANPILKSGELAIVTLPTVVDPVTQVPAVLLKVGNGKDAFKTLPWLNALAADVYDWAKAATKPTYAASEISDLADFITSQVQDTNTKYRIVSNGNNKWDLQSKELTDGNNWTYVSTFSFTAPDVPEYTLASGTTNGSVALNKDGTSLGDVSVKGLQDAAYTTIESLNSTALGYANGFLGTVTGTSSDASTALTLYGIQKAANAATSISYTVTIPAASWSSSNSQFTYTYSNNKLRVSVAPIICCTQNQSEYSYITEAEATASSGITFTARKKPTAEMTLLITDIG